MGKFRLTTAAALAVSLTMGASPALAADPPVDAGAPVVASTGLMGGQLVGQSRRLYPNWTDDNGVTKVEVLGSDRTQG
ncbi:hypothetical protein AB0C12_21905 [Actinoplanes sp. NPDC048967]|uniref:hypothetical protein n=1 Tax=Actinoplanes sp. NPDC048967 TaxID=3155269 RepID=UPI0033F262EF